MKKFKIDPNTFAQYEKIWGNPQPTVYRSTRPTNVARVVADIEAIAKKSTQIDKWKKELSALKDGLLDGMMTVDEYDKMCRVINRKIRMFERFNREHGYYPTLEEIGVQDSYIL